MVKYCEDNDILLEAYSPIARAEKIADEKLVKLAKKLDKTPAQVLINWSLCKGFITLPKTVTESRLLSNLEALNFRLSEEDLAEMDQWDGVDFTPGWDPANYPLDK